MNSVIGILAHVDAGKTTLAEAILYSAGKLRQRGRVDSGDTVMDTHALERARGITIFTSGAVFDLGGRRFTMLDTPGHVDFSAETERVLSVLDSAVLVISGTDGVQAHTRTLWRLLSLYNVPTVVFVTKMDFARLTKDEILNDLKSELSDAFAAYGDDEAFALFSEELLEKHLSGEKITDGDIARLVKARLAFPVFFGSGLKLDGVGEFLDVLPHIVTPDAYPDAFGAKVFKISRDARGERLTHLKVTGGTLRVRDAVGERKISGIRIYSGGKYESVDAVSAGDVCAVTGLSDSYGGEGLGFEKGSAKPCLEPVMSYKLILPDDADPKTVLPKLRLLEEEDPQLKFTWDGFLQEIHVSLMGKVQAEILKSVVSMRFDIDIGIGTGRVMYKETLKEKVEGVGHYEPLRHYAEVHLIMEPLPRGSGLRFQSAVSEDSLERNWQRLILMHLGEKQHLGVLTGSPITDMKITLAAGRAHLKHTEGGDFRQATYRAVRQGLMKAECELLEPYYAFMLKVPPEQIGRAINDIRARCGTFDSPEESGDMYMLRGRAPVTTLEGYAAEVAAFTGGRGQLSLEIEGYDTCHDTERVLEKIGYNPEADIENTPDSVFCAHGGGFNVKWDKVSEYMHLESCLAPIAAPIVNKRNLRIDDKELEAIMLREFGPVRHREYEVARVKTKTHEEVRVFENIPKKRLLIVDGYNVIFAWDDLKALAKDDLSLARERLIQILSNYTLFDRCETVLVFDAYRVPHGTGEKYDTDGIHVVYTKEHETGDAYIEKLVSDIGKNDSVRVVTSDGLIQLSAIRAGVLRVSALEFERDVDDAYTKMQELIDNINKN